MKRLAFIALFIAVPVCAQNPAAAAARGRGAGSSRLWRGHMDSTRVRELYVSKDPADLQGCSPVQCERYATAKRRTDSVYAANAPGHYKFSKIHYMSRAGGLEIPAYVFAPLDQRSKHAALVWVHGGVHGDWGASMYPFVAEAVQRGYVVITPDYRGSTGYGDEWMKKIDYGGKEIDDVLSAVDYLATLPYVDTARMGIMGWSHGGFITSHILFRDDNPFKAGAAIVPVTNLVFRLMDHGPSYARNYAPEEGIQGLPFESNCGPKHDHDCIDEYLKRSPVFHVENLKVPMHVDVATNDCDVFFREDQQMAYTLMALKPKLAEVKIYKDPPYVVSYEPLVESRALAGHKVAECGHVFSRRVNPKTLKRVDSPEQIDSWNRTWAFFERNLK
jgi:dipeptidyl aminopeptidase/acylaminoacyl peptidase